MDNGSRNKASMVFSYLALRKTVGILGIAFPFVLSLGALIFFRTGIQGSISGYYHTGMRDVFVGILCVIGFFLLSYRGHGCLDDIVGDLACIFAVGVALFPTNPECVTEGGTRIIGHLHQVFATLFFLTLICFSLLLFTKTHKHRTPTRRKKQRNKVYKICGCTMFVCILLIGILSLFPDDVKSSLKPIKPVYWLEAFAVFAFGVSWFTKGEAILKDQVQGAE
ncbi:MAG: DUF998 domain-containing protein [Candidatus Latescibacterota bacterium]|nr:MAG: DUF998 domain-containing protein [Candidatus Latescibacterota bacterium]